MRNKNKVEFLKIQQGRIMVELGSLAKWHQKTYQQKPYSLRSPFKIHYMTIIVYLYNDSA